MGKRVIGASRLRRKLKRLPEEVSGELKGVIATEGAVVLSDMKSRAPVSLGALQPADFQGNPRPHLRDALDMRFSKDGLRVRIGLIGKRVMKVFFFARYLEFGTRYIEKRPFLFPGWRARRPQTRAAIKAATVRALRRVAHASMPDV